MKHADSDIYITANAAVEAVAKVLGDPVKAKEILADFLRDGKIEAIAGWKWESTKKTRAEAWQSDDDSTGEADVQIDRSYWRSSRNWREDVEEWRWVDNRFVINTNPPRRLPNWVFIEDVRFLKINVATAIKFVEQSLASTLRKKGAGGRRPDEENWVAVALFLLRTERAGKLNKAGYPSQKELRAAILEDIDDAFEEGTLVKRISEIYRAMVDPPTGD